VTVVVVVGATTGAAVVVVTPAPAGGTVVEAPVAVAPSVDVSAVPAVLAFVATGAVVVVDRDEAADREEPPGPPPPPREPCESLDCVLAIPCAPAPRAMCFGLPAVATSSAISARDTARMTHQLGRPRATLGRRPSEDPVP
jgi:hypothetical protein